MDTATDVFVRCFDEQFDRVLTAAFAHTEWLDEAADVGTVVMCEFKARLIVDPDDRDIRWMEARAGELGPERRGSRPGSDFLDRHLRASTDSIRTPLSDLGDALEDYDLEPGDVIDTATGPVLVLRAALRDAIGGLPEKSFAPRGRVRRFFGG